MKTLSLVFGVLAILFMVYGLYLLFNLTQENVKITFFALLGGFLSITMFLITDILASKK